MTSLIFRLFPKMVFSEEDKHAIKFLRQNKHGAKRFSKEFPHKGWSRSRLDNIIRLVGLELRNVFPAVAVRALLERITKLKKLKHLF